MSELFAMLQAYAAWDFRFDCEKGVRLRADGVWVSAPILGVGRQLWRFLAAGKKSVAGDSPFACVSATVPG